MARGTGTNAAVAGKDAVWLGMVSADALRMVAAPEEGAGPGGEGGEEGDESEEEPPDSDMERQLESFDEDQY